MCVSVVSIWECAIKADRGELKLPRDFLRSLEPAGFELLEIRMEHLETYGTASGVSVREGFRHTSQNLL